MGLLSGIASLGLSMALSKEKRKKIADALFSDDGIKNAIVTYTCCKKKGSKRKKYRALVVELVKKIMVENGYTKTSYFAGTVADTLVDVGTKEAKKSGNAIDCTATADDCDDKFDKWKKNMRELIQKAKNGKIKLRI
jgi:hypothetical protein